MLTDAVVFDAPNQFHLSIDGYGSEGQYSLSVNGSGSSGITYYQNSIMDDLANIAFSNQFGTTEFTLDDIRVHGIPEPSTLMLIGMGIPGLLLRRRWMR